VLRFIAAGCDLAGSAPTASATAATSEKIRDERDVRDGITREYLRTWAADMPPMRLVPTRM
jgi:hypothetical protein